MLATDPENGVLGLKWGTIKPSDQFTP